MGLTGKAGKGGGVTLADNLVEPCSPLDISGAFPPQCQPSPVKVFSGVEYIFQGVDKQIRLISHTAVKIGEEPIVVVIDLKIVAGWLVKQYPAPTSKHLDIPFIEQREAANYLLSKRLLSTYPAHKTIQRGSPPSSRSLS